MTRLEKIEKLKKYREILVYATGYQEKEETINEKKEQKVLVLRRKFYGKNLKVS